MAVALDQNLSLKSPLPFASRFFMVGDLRLHYLDEGKGEAVILLHGNPTWSYFFRGLIKDLSTQFRVIVPDHLGCGLSDKGENNHFRLIHRIDHLQRLLDHLKLQRYSLVMHDWGGAIGTGVALRNISKIDRLIYLNTTLGEIELLPRLFRWLANPRIGKHLTHYSCAFLQLALRCGTMRKLPRTVHQSYCLPYSTAKNRSAIADFVEDIPFNSSHPSRPEIDAIAAGVTALEKVPVAIIWGMEDPCFHRGIFTQFSRRFPQAELLTLPHASHLLLEDEPELSSRMIKRFLLRDRSTLCAWGRLRRDLYREEGGDNPFIDQFLQVAQTNGDQTCVIEARLHQGGLSYSHRSYGQLANKIDRYRHGLIKLGLKVGDRVVILVPGGEEFLALSYAVMSAGAIPCLLDPGMGRDNLLHSIEELSPQGFIASPKGHLLRILYRKYFRSLTFHLIAKRFSFGRMNLTCSQDSSSPPLIEERGSISLIAYTSGATGRPKGVIFTHSMVREFLRIFREEFGMSPGTRDLPLLITFAIGNLANGVCTIFAPMDASRPLDFDPAHLVQMIQETKPESSFGSPTLWNKIATHCFKEQKKLPSLQRIFMTGVAVPPTTMDLLQQALPHGESFTPYGATEALPITMVSRATIKTTPLVRAVTGEEGVFVGSPLPGISLKIIEPYRGAIERIEKALVLPPAMIGEVIVCGKNISPFYFNNPDANQQNKILDGSTFWHRLGDLGYLDDEGGLYYCGRVADVVRCHGRIFHTVPLERIFERHPKVYRSAIIPYRDGSDVAVVIEPYPHFWSKGSSMELLRQEIAAIASSNPLTAPIQRIFFYPSFPVDGRHNAKIFRDKLAILSNSGQLS